MAATRSPRRRVLPTWTNIDRGACGIGFIANRYGRADHAILQMGLQALINLEHRGALNADGMTGDGAGIMTSLPRPFFAREAERLTGHPVQPDTLAVATLFLYPEAVDESRATFESALAVCGLHLLAWRDVPHNPNLLGEFARNTQPFITQALIELPAGLNETTAEQRLFLARKRFDRDSRVLGLAAYVVSCSAQTIVYKGLLLAPQLAEFYSDLRDPLFAPHFITFHQRYSTNTLPAWHRAQPFRLLCHNGEINTVQGNIAWMTAREADLRIEAPAFSTRADDLCPVIDLDGSDSAMLDNALELLVRGGRDVRHAMTMLMPAAWEKSPDLPKDVREFYRYHAALSEPWDGPAAIVFGDGRMVGATLDRNGLRPLRYFITHDGLLGAASEAGCIPVPDSAMLVKDRLGPGQMVACDTRTGDILGDAELKTWLAARQPYGAWLRQNLRPLTNRAFPLVSRHTAHPSLLTAQAAFGYTSEELVVILRPMVENRAEAIGSMGDDTPAAALSPKPRPLFAYFRQRFAEVTNPPIDYLREPHVMSLRVRIGARPNLLAETPEHAALIELESPLLADDTLNYLRHDPAMHARTLDTRVKASTLEKPGGLARAVQMLCARAESAARSGAHLLILSDNGVDENHSHIPALLAVSAVHHHLLRVGLRGRVSVVVESGEPRDVHHLACLLGFGANAINPYLALATAAGMADAKLSAARAMRNYLHAAEHGLLKIMSKMGITTLDAYMGAQIFEAAGLSHALIAQHFEGTPSFLGGLEMDDIARITRAWHALAFPREGKATLESHGFYKFKRGGEVHAFSPATVHALHEAVENGDYTKYKLYSQLVHQRESVDFRDLLDFKPGGLPVALSEVEPANTIYPRISTAAMSHGALSAEAHEMMAVAMNRLGAVSNSGEGGEHPSRYTTEKNDRIKQVASARFGVTADYLLSAEELQIKIAQGSKPGEGGQLPSSKVTAEIAAIRHAQPGIMLISPPPHHDIYSIEDLAQLIYDLRQINPRATISVKLVAQAGVGTIAAGVAKAGADIVQISGHNGGTGASPLSSVKYAGVSWELGLADTQYALVNSGLRGRIRVRVDGGFRTGRDVVMAALMGADEFSFGTAAALAIGCVMARACHLNTCPVGIATQDPKLRAKFQTPPDHLMNFIRFVVDETRELLAALGLRSLADATGRSDLLAQVSGGLPDQPPLDLIRLITPPETDTPSPRRYVGELNPVAESAKRDSELIGEGRRAINAREAVTMTYAITNRNRTTGGRLAHALTEEKALNPNFADHRITVQAHGSAGQSFGAFGVAGLELHLTGEANDYVGKGLAGGLITVRAAPEYPGEHPVLAGNAVLYGATGGEVFIAGRAGERFCVRNSGATAVVEGVGDHGCEYMTGGVAVVLGAIGRNFGAGMSGGVAYVYAGHFGADVRERINPSMVTVDELEASDMARLCALLARHTQLTGSARAHDLLTHFRPDDFVRITPRREPLDTSPKGEPVMVPLPTVS